MTMRLNKLCDIEDWQDPDFRATVRRIHPNFVHSMPGYPAGREHRKHWEYAHLLNGLDRLGAIHPEALVLSVAGGFERPAFDLTNRVRSVYHRLIRRYRIPRQRSRSHRADRSLIRSPSCLITAIGWWCST